MTSKELEKELYDSIESYVSKIHESVKNKNEFIKNNRKDWEQWKKHAKKNKAKALKHVEIKKIPEDCNIPQISVLLTISYQ